MYKIISTIIKSLFMIFLSCRLFYPDSPVEDPEEYTEPLNFSGILDGTGKTFSKKRYEEMFHEDFYYEEKDGNNFNRSQMIDRFNEIEQDIDTVVWEKNPEFTDDFFEESDTISLYRLYNIMTAADTIDNKPLYDTLDSGNSRFELVYYESKNTWSILEWHNDHNSPGVTYFNPEYPQ